MLAGRRRTGRPPRWAVANDGERSCATPPWGRKSRIREVPYGDHRDRAPFKRPKDRRPAGRAEVITDVVSDGGTHTVGLQTVVDLGFAGDRNVCILREDGADLKGAACPPLTEIAVTGQTASGFFSTVIRTRPQAHSALRVTAQRFAQAWSDDNQSPDSWVEGGTPEDRTRRPAGCPHYGVRPRKVIHVLESPGTRHLDSRTARRRRRAGNRLVAHFIRDREAP